MKIYPPPQKKNHISLRAWPSENTIFLGGINLHISLTIMQLMYSVGSSVKGTALHCSNNKLYSTVRLPYIIFTSKRAKKYIINCININILMYLIYNSFENSSHLLLFFLYTVYCSCTKQVIFPNAPHRILSHTDTVYRPHRF